MARQPKFPPQRSSKYDASRSGGERKPDHNRSSHDAAPQLDKIEDVSGRWLVKAMLATILAAGIALYLTVCLLFYQGQWQFVFSPHRTPHAAGRDWLSSSWAKRTGPAPKPNTAPLSAASIASSSGLPISDHKFDYTEEGVARLDGWWIPAGNTAVEHNSSGARQEARSAIVLLFCPDGRSDLPDNVAAFRAFHALGVSVFAFDYRGFGTSQPGHPSQQKAYEDGVAALRYLTDTLHIDPRRIVIYGAELGSAVAAQVAQQSPQIAGVILENPQPSLTKQVRREQHIHVLPMWLIFPDRFDISRIVPSLKMPKLVIATPAEPEYEAGAVAVYNEAAKPKEKLRVEATPLYSQSAWQQAMQRFLNAAATQSR